MNKRNAAGFTLLETLVALVVLGFLMAGLAEGLRFGVAAWQTQARKTAERSDLDAVDRTLRTLIARMDPGGFSPQQPALVGNARNIVFTTSLPQAADALPSRDADVTLGVDEAHQMRLQWLVHYRNRIGRPPLPENVVLRNDVDHLEIAYWQASKTGWQNEWTERALPKLIRIRVVPVRDGGHRGPDIVIAPMRDRWRQ
jgi:prepilin-type N-terminal cleavage/methylation domain-containing protein